MSPAEKGRHFLSMFGLTASILAATVPEGVSVAITFGPRFRHHANAEGQQSGQTPPRRARSWEMRRLLAPTRPVL
jgi:hypothetical protein